MAWHFIMKMIKVKRFLLCLKLSSALCAQGEFWRDLVSAHDGGVFAFFDECLSYHLRLRELTAPLSTSLAWFSREKSDRMIISQGSSAERKLEAGDSMGPRIGEKNGRDDWI